MQKDEQQSARLFSCGCSAELYKVCPDGLALCIPKSIPFDLQNKERYAPAIPHVKTSFLINAILQKEIQHFEI